MASASASFLYPSPSEAALKTQFIGKDLYELDGPAAVLDSAVIKRNCRLMLETVKKLNVGFRAHVKPHKVSQSPMVRAISILTIIIADSRTIAVAGRRRCPGSPPCCINAVGD